MADVFAVKRDKKTKKDMVLTARVEESHYDAYAEAARLEGRTLSGWVEWHLDAVVGLRPVAAKRTAAGAVAATKRTLKELP